MTTSLPSPDFELAGFDVAAFIRATLAEDLGKGLPGGGRGLLCGMTMALMIGGGL